MRIIILLFIYLLTGIGVFGQSKIYTGYYINPGGDSVFGSFPDYTQWSRNPDQVAFTPINAPVPIMLAPGNCTGFEVTGEDRYRSFTGNRLLNPITDVDVLKSKATMPLDEYGTINCFLRIVASNAQGTLYVFRDTRRTNFFFQVQGQPIEELRFKMYERDNKISEIREYRQQLYNAFRERITTREQMQLLEKLGYEEKEMELFMELLEPFGTRKRKRNPAEGWLVAVGVSVNGMRVPGDNIAIETAHQYNTSVSPVVSVGYMLPVGRHFNRYFFYPKVSVYRYENTGASTVGNFIYQTRYQSNLAFSGILQGGFYLLNMQSFKAFIAAGAGMMKLYNHKEISTTLHVSDNTINNQYETPISKVTYQFSLTAGCNIRQSVFTMASFNAPAPVADFVYYYPQHYSFQFGLGYRF